MNDEMGFIVAHSLAEYPLWQAEAALAATAQQLVHVATGEGTSSLDSPYLRHYRALYALRRSKPMRAARQQHWGIDFARSTGSTFRSR